MADDSSVLVRARSPAVLRSRDNAKISRAKVSSIRSIGLNPRSLSHGALDVDEKHGHVQAGVPRKASTCMAWIYGLPYLTYMALKYFAKSFLKQYYADSHGMSLGFGAFVVVMTVAINQCTTPLVGWVTDSVYFNWFGKDDDSKDGSKDGGICSGPSSADARTCSSALSVCAFFMSACEVLLVESI